MYVMDGFDALRPEDLVSSTAPGDPIGVWDAGRTYYKGELVYGSDGITVYECAIGPATYLAGSYCGAKFGEGLPNLNNNPEEYPTVPAMDRAQYPDYIDIDDCYKESGLMWWIKRGEYWENKYRMFQESPDLITQAFPAAGVTSFSVTCRARQNFTDYAFFRLVATTIEITSGSNSIILDLRTGIDHIPGADVYTRIANRLEFEVQAGEEFTVTFTHDPALRTNIQNRYVFDPYHPVPNPESETITAAACGYMACGNFIYIGATLYQTSMGIRDYSRKERDAFGRAIITPRDYTNIVSYKVAVDTEDIYGVVQFLASVRSILSVYGDRPWTRGEETQAALVVGYFKDFSIPIESYTQSIFTLEVEGL